MWQPSLFRLCSQVTHNELRYNFRSCRNCRSLHFKQITQTNFRRCYRNEERWLHGSMIQKGFSGLKSQSNRKQWLHKGWSKWYPASGEYNEEQTGEKNGEPAATMKKGKIDTIVKVMPKRKKSDIDFSKAFYDNNLITHTRAMDELMLTIDDIKDIQSIKRRSPFPESEDMVVLLRKDVEKKAIEKYGSLEKIQKERQKLIAKNTTRKAYREALHGTLPPHYVEMMKEAQKESIFEHGPGKVVMYAIVINGINCVMKGGAWLFTGSHSMFSEFVHSMADTANQIILAFGIHQSLKKADQEHPYGWSSFRNVSSLISGVGIFCIGAGLSFYHGIQGLLNPGHIEPLFWAIAILGGSFISEGATLMVAINQVKMSSKARNLSFFEYVWRSEDPSTNVVLLEDFAAILGVSIAASCMSLSYYYNTAIPDAVGSLIIGGLLATTATFIIYSNTVSLVGRSIHPVKKQQMMKDLESDRMIRALHDVKATDIGGNYIRFKAEVDFDGKEVTRKYLTKQDIDMEQMLKEVTGLTTTEELESFMIKHGDHIVDTLGSEVDRIEKNLKKRHPELRHVDLEQL